MTYPSRASDRAIEGSLRLRAGSFITDVRVWAGNPLSTATSPRSVRNELAKKFSNHTPSRRKRCMLGITSSPSTRSSMSVRPKLSQMTTTTLGRDVRSSPVSGTAEGRSPRRRSKRRARSSSSKKGYIAA